LNLKYQRGRVTQHHHEQSENHSHHHRNIDEDTPRHHSRKHSHHHKNIDENSPRHHSHKHSHHDTSIDESSSQQHSHKHKHHHRHHHHHHEEQSAVHNETIRIPAAAETTTVIADVEPSGPMAYYYPFAYPPMPVYAPPVVEQVTKPRQTNRTATKTTKTTKTGIKQSEKATNLIHNGSKLKIEHHYVDSAAESERLINDLRRRGFVETGIETSGIYSDNKKK
jgi:hypothetical protein